MHLGAQRQHKVVEEVVEVERVATAAAHLHDRDLRRHRRDDAHDVRQQTLRGVDEALDLRRALLRLGVRLHLVEHGHDVLDVRLRPRAAVQEARGGAHEAHRARREGVEGAHREARHDVEGVHAAGAVGGGGGLRGLLLFGRLGHVTDGAVDLVAGHGDLGRLGALEGGGVEVRLRPGVRDDLLERVALLGVDDEHLADQVPHGLREVLGHAVVATLDLVEEMVHVGVVEGQVTRKHDKENHTAAPHISHEAIVALLLEDLGGDVVGCAADGLEQRAVALGTAALEVGESEITDLEVVIAVKQEVLGLEVAVGDALLVAVVRAEHELLEELPRRGLVEPLRGDNAVEELAAGDELKHKVDVVGRLQHLPELDDVLVLQHLHDGDLALQLLLHVLLGELGLVHDLDGPLVA
eukprot:PhM_4_TR2067/c4_g1_i1/m.99921